MTQAASSLTQTEAEEPPLVSFVVPVFNVAASQLHQSLHSAAAQNLERFECIVVDDSTDPACAAACRQLCDSLPRFRYLKPPTRLGLAGSLNFGVQHARGEWIARFDADDLCLPDRLARQLAYLQAHPQVEVLGTALEVIDPEGRSVALRRYPTEHAAIERKMQFSNAMAHPTVMMRRSLFERHGGYDPQFRFSEDLELWLRWLNCGVRFANLPQPLVRYRQAHTRRGRTNWEFNLRARKRHFCRRHLLRRALGIAAIAIWARLPAPVQESVFRLLMFRRSA